MLVIEDKNKGINQNKNINQDAAVKKLIRDTLLALGIAPNYKGFSRIETALMLLLENEDYLFAMIKELYPDVAKKLNSSAKKVERNIRHAKEEAEFAYTLLWRELFKYADPEKKITNGYFLARVLMYLKDVLAEDLLGMENTKNKEAL